MATSNKHNFGLASMFTLMVLSVAAIACQSSGSDSELQRSDGPQAGSWPAAGSTSAGQECPDRVHTLMDFLEEPWNGLVAGTVVAVEPVLDRYNLADGTVRQFDEPRTCPMSMSPALRVHLTDVLTSWGETHDALTLHVRQNHASTLALRPRVPANSTEIVWEEARGTTVRENLLPPGAGLRIVLPIQPLENGELLVTAVLAMEVDDEDRLNVVDISSCLETDAHGQDFQNWFGAIIEHFDGRVPEVVERPAPVRLGSECDAFTQ